MISSYISSYIVRCKMFLLFDSQIFRHIITLRTLTASEIVPLKFHWAILARICSIYLLQIKTKQFCLCFKIDFGFVVIMCVSCALILITVSWSVHWTWWPCGTFFTFSVWLSWTSFSFKSYTVHISKVNIECWCLTLHILFFSNKCFEVDSWITNKIYVYSVCYMLFLNVKKNKTYLLNIVQRPIESIICRNIHAK